MISIELLLKYDNNLKVYLDKFEKVEDVRQKCPFLNNKSDNLLGIVEQFYNKFTSKALEGMQAYKGGLVVY